jgi:hypothetical protein
MQRGQSASAQSLYEAELAAARSVDVDGMTYEQLQELCDKLGNVRHGLSRAAFQRMPTRLLTRPSDAQPAARKLAANNAHGAAQAPAAQRLHGEACCICMSDLLEAGAASSRVKTLPCGHVFHAPCVAQWLSSHTSCPVCKCDVATRAASVGELFSKLCKS